tara:strand:- start:636 stop:938 length:303 start_codon:yes stop_codon:yes gene_type:complete
MQVQFRLKDMDTFLREYAMNISYGGIFIKTLKPHPQDSMLYLQIQLENGTKIIEGLGKVVHVNSANHTHAGMGIEFINIDQESQQFINNLVNERMNVLKS